MTFFNVSPQRSWMRMWTAAAELAQLIAVGIFEAAEMPAGEIPGCVEFAESFRFRL